MLDPLAELLGGATEPRPLQPGEFEAQLLDQGVGLDRLARHADDQTLERVDVVGQQGRIESHANSLGLAEGARHSLGPGHDRLGNLPPQPAIVGRSVRRGVRQSMPSSSMASRAGVSAAAAPAVAGQPVQPNSLTHEFMRILALAATLPRIRFHDLRHSHATQMLANGIHPKIAQERLGRSSIAITLDLYSHVLPGMQEDAATKVDAALRAAIDRTAG
ncbi:tyrosine-type recombinase/integrase [Methylobacterium sp. Leaf118]|uniref:tyrosine-type recombinase/integrase n=1 Tax=Methylobacterium sp. Leaf118 TaxID=2876562 RepID=UPI001E5FD4BA|nr:tyrosine-type recombinase/integrase [Methylobacterium sp. Leaf118]